MIESKFVEISNTTIKNIGINGVPSAGTM